MTGWTEKDSRAFLDIAAVAVPRRLEMLVTTISLVPFLPAEAPRIVELGAGDGRLASDSARADLAALTDTLTLLMRRLDPAALGPPPLAAKFT